MQIDAACSTCPACGSVDLKIVPVIHHMLCSYVGPEYDFAADARGYHCPKCQRWLRDRGNDWEVVSRSAHCLSCGAEYVVTERPAHCVGPEIVARLPDAHVPPLHRRRSDARNGPPSPSPPSRFRFRR